MQFPSLMGRIRLVHMQVLLHSLGNRSWYNGTVMQFIWQTIAEQGVRTFPPSKFDSQCCVQKCFNIPILTVRSSLGRHTRHQVTLYGQSAKGNGVFRTSQTLQEKQQPPCSTKNLISRQGRISKGVMGLKKAKARKETNTKTFIKTSQGYSNKVLLGSA